MSFFVTNAYNFESFAGKYSAVQISIHCKVISIFIVLRVKSFYKKLVESPLVNPD